MNIFDKINLGKKKIFLIIALIIVLMLIILGYIYLRKNKFQEQKKFILTTAISYVKPLLEDVSTKHLPQNKFSTEIQFYSSNYVDAIDQVANKRADATLCCHIPYIVNNLNNHESWKNLQIVQPVYIAKFGIFCNTNTIKSIDNIINKEDLKIVVPDDKANLSLSLYYLYKLSEKYPLFREKLKIQDNIKRTIENEFWESYNLKLRDFTISKDLTIIQKNLFQIGNFCNEPNATDLAINFPALMSSARDHFEYCNFFNMQKKDIFADKFLNIYAISLISRKDNQNSEPIEIIKNGLKESSEMVASTDGSTQAMFNQNTWLIPKDKIEEIKDNILEFQKKMKNK
ncbi:MAG: hypothetical protein Q8784_00065 [Vigna little leaf phytoplasma]|nr:hypothetical protein [Vigna little leaf phytoplasma]